MAKSTTRKVTLGPNAYSFNDQSTGISIARGEIVELTLTQLSTPRIKKALNQGHIQYAIGDEQKYSDEDIQRFIKRLRQQHSKGMEPSKVAKNYSLEEMKLVAEELGYGVEDGDTVLSLVTTIFEEFTHKNTEK